MKRLSRCYMQIHRIFWDRYRNKRVVYKSPYKNLSVNSKWLYITLKEIENGFTGSKNNEDQVLWEGVRNSKDWFYHSLESVAEQAGMSVSSVKRSKKELTEVGLISTCRVFFVDQYGRKNPRWITGFYLHDGMNVDP